MEYICHRINTINELKTIPDIYGVEIDLRDNLNGEIYIQHNPFENGESFTEYLKHYHHGTMILNIKSEGIEEKVLDEIKKSNVNSYFFLDSSFPMINKISSMGIKNTALRFSEYEGIDTIKNMSGKSEWVWVDCFTSLPLNKEYYNDLRSAGYKICIVSPELQGQPEKVELYAKQMVDEGIVPDAICTKYYMLDLWKRFF